MSPHPQLSPVAPRRTARIAGSRRRFLRSAAAGAAGWAAVPGVLSARSPLSRLQVAAVGVGGKGPQNLKGISREGEAVVAICDVDRRYRERSGQEYPGARLFGDYRQMLEKAGGDIEAVVVSTPDHSHAAVAVAAMREGKHVYCEKPLAHSIYECRRLAEVARETGLATQMGNGGHANEKMRQLAEWLAAGAIGAVREVHVWTDRPVWPQGWPGVPPERPPVPDYFDWDRWLGPAPARPYHHAYHPFHWRGRWDFGTGALGDMGPHLIDPAYWALDLGYPEWVEAEHSGVNAESPPKWSIVRFRFPARGGRAPVDLVWYDGGKRPPPGLLELEPGRKPQPNGSCLVGTDGKILYDRGKLRLTPKAAMEAFEAPGPTLPRSPGHYREWIDACKGGAPAGSAFAYSGPFTEVVLLGNLAIRLGRRVRFDPGALAVEGAPEAASLIRRPYRERYRDALR